MNKNASLPLEPLWRLAEVRADLHSEGGKTGFTQQVFADMISTSTRAVQRWFVDGTIPWVSADEAAVALGLHPSLVWGDAWWNVKGDFEVIARKATRDLENDLTDFVAAEGMDF